VNHINLQPISQHFPVIVQQSLVKLLPLTWGVSH